MNNTLKYLLLCLVCLCTTTAMAQRRISGTVSDDFDVIPGASVVEVDKNNRIVSGTTTDMNGNFTLQIKSDKDVLRITFMGLADFKEVIGNRSVFKVKLKENTIQMKEVVKTAKRKTTNGGLTIPQREMTGASQTFSMDEMEGLAFESVDQALQGQIAGLDIVANSGNLGAGTTMRIRGTSSINGDKQPLIVVDDHIFDIQENTDIDWATMDNEEMFSSLLNVNTDDIESIVVLKDASSCAKWGARGANGVIEIKLKRGKAGPTRVNFSYKFMGSYQPEGYNMLSGDDYTMMLKEAFFNKNRETEKIYEIDYNPEAPDIYHNFKHNTDWVDAVKRNGQTHQFYLSISGGGEKAKYRASAGYNTNPVWTVIGQKMTQFTTAINLDYTVSERIAFHSSVNFSNTKNHRNYHGIMGQAYMAMPNMAIYRYDHEGNPTNDYFIMWPMGPNSTTPDQTKTNQKFADKFGAGNPVANGYLAWSEQISNVLNPQFSVDYKILGKDNDSHQLNYNGDVFMTASTTSTNPFLPAELSNTVWSEGNRNSTGSDENKFFSFSTRHTLQFYPHFANDDHYMAAQARFDLSSNFSTGQSIHAWNLPTGTTSPSTQAVLQSPTTSTSESRSQSFFFNVHYSYKSKYIIAASLNINGSSGNSANDKYTFNPSVSLRWNISDEKFMSWSKKWLSMLSFAPSWGMLPSTHMNSTMLYSTYSGSLTGYGSPSYAPSTLALRSIKMEKQNELNIRTNIGLFNDLITAEFDYYDRIRTDLQMSNKSVPSANGIQSLSWANAGRMRNRGWDLNINTGKLCKVSKFSMRLKANFAQVINRIEEMDEIVLAQYNNDNPALSNNNYSALARLQVNNAYGSIYGFRFKGVYAYDYGHNGYSIESKNAYGDYTVNGGYAEGKPHTDEWKINTYAAAVARGEVNASCPLVRDAQGNIVTDRYGNPKQMTFNYQNGGSYVFTGGDAIYEDINHDGQIDRYDVVYLGNSNPKLSGGFGITLTWDRLSLTANFNYRVGADAINTLRAQLESMSGSDNQSFATTWRWRKNGDITTMPRALNGTNYNQLPSDRYVENTDYLRFNYLQLTYDVPTNFCKKVGLNSLKLSASLQNVAVWSKYTGADPEVAQGGVYNIAQDGGRTPRAKQYSFNINIGF